MPSLNRKASMVSRLTHPLALSVRYREPGAKQIKKGWKMGRIDGAERCFGKM